MFVVPLSCCQLLVWAFREQPRLPDWGEPAPTQELPAATQDLPTATQELPAATQELPAELPATQKVTVFSLIFLVLLLKLSCWWSILYFSFNMRVPSPQIRVQTLPKR